MFAKATRPLEALMGMCLATSPWIVCEGSPVVLGFVLDASKCNVMCRKEIKALR